MLGEVERMLRAGQGVTLRAKGNSMLPFIRGDRDSVELQPADEVSDGDVVLACLSGAAYVLHRVIAIDGDNVTLMGDGNVSGTELCLKKDVSGVVTRIICDGKIVDCHSRGYRVKVRIWRWLLPLRRYMLYLYCHIILKNTVK